MEIILKSDFDRTIIVKTKDKLDKNISHFINDLRQFSKIILITKCMNQH